MDVTFFSVNRCQRASDIMFYGSLDIFLTLLPTRKRSANPSARHSPRANSFLKHENLHTVELRMIKNVHRTTLRTYSVVKWPILGVDCSP